MKLIQLVRYWKNDIIYIVLRSEANLLSQRKNLIVTIMIVERRTCPIIFSCRAIKIFKTRVSVLWFVILRMIISFFLLRKGLIFLKFHIDDIFSYYSDSEIVNIDA